MENSTVMLTNFERLIKIAEETFDMMNDSSQLSVNPQIIERLKQMHPATLSEYSEGDGPIAWVLVIPTTEKLMKKFLSEEINERELFEKTPVNIKYEAIYLCSALVLEEYRRKGITKQLAINSINEIKKDNPIEHLFVWTFSKEGKIAAESIARAVNLPLNKKIKQNQL